MPENQPNWKVRSNDSTFLITQTQLADAGIVQKSATEFSCIKDSRSVNAVVTGEDMASKKISIEIEGEQFDVVIKDQLDQMLDEMGFSITSSKQIKEIKAPMPGMVLDVTVKERQEVKEGERLLILGAMKMENSITIAADAVIKKINVKAGQAVEKGQVLIELE